MGRSFANKFKHKSKKFLHKTHKVAAEPLHFVKDVVGQGTIKLPIESDSLVPPFRLPQLPRKLERVVNPLEQAKFIIRSRGTKRGKKIGGILEKVGGVISLAGAVTGQPEIAAVGVGLQVVGEFEEGKSAGEIVGGVVGGFIGGELGGPVGGKIGGDIGSKLGSGIDKELGDTSTDRTHNKQHKDQIVENQHMSDKAQHHKVQLPNDLQATGRETGGVASNLGKGLLDVAADNVGEILAGVDGAQEVGALIKFLSANFDTIEHLTQVDQDKIFDEVLDSGLLEEILGAILSNV